MARSLSWIDNDELTALFEVIGPKRGQPDTEGPSTPGADSWSDFGARRPPAPRRARPPSPRPATERPASPLVAEKAWPAAPPVTARARPAVPAPAFQAPAPEPRVVPFRPGQGSSLPARLEQFFDWVLEQAPVQGAVIADDQGLVVARRDAGELEAALAISLEQLFGRVNSLFSEDAADRAEVAGHVVLRHRERLLITVWTPTDYGRYYGVFIGRTVPGAELLELAGKGLETVFAG